MAALAHRPIVRDYGRSIYVTRSRLRRNRHPISQWLRFRLVMLGVI